MQQHGSKYLPTDPTPGPGEGSKGQKSTFSEIVMLHIKFNEITHAATW